ncbi:MAG TPA: hypothetical protein PLH19_04645 [Anaerolineae bacterium]|nr:hypothetical protein [Anaerolineae bacterium]HQH37811.1 hypothetical protein [Anaerolineae bacterium]
MIEKLASPLPRPKITRTVLLRAGAGYGLLFGLGFALFVWGYDALALSRSSADMAWAKLLLGLPCLLIIGGAAGILGAWSSSAGLTTCLWGITLGGVGWLAGHLPFAGMNWLAGVIDPRFAGLTLWPYTEGNALRTLLVVIAYTVYGFGVGYVETLAIEWAWDRATPEGRMKGGAWSVLLVACVMALPPAFVLDYLVLSPIRTPQVRAADFIETYLEGGEAAVRAAGQNIAEAQRHGAHFTPRYTIYFAGFDNTTETLFAAYSDIAFDSGFALRCLVMGGRITFCDDLSQKLDLYIGQMVQAGKTGERPWLANPMKTFNVTEDVVTWLQTHQAELGDTYRLTVTAQKGDWMFVTAQFDAGTAMTCRFHGNAVITVDQCEFGFSGT